MRVLVAGATGVIGRQVVPLLLSVGHDVIALTKGEGDRAAALQRAGASVVVADALDRNAVLGAVRNTEPDAVVDMLTAIPPALNPRKMAAQFALTNRLRTGGTRNLVEAAAGRRIITQGLAYVYDPSVAALADEDAAWWPQPPEQFAGVLAALREHEQLTTAANGLVLRFGHLYGPGSMISKDGSIGQQVRAGKLPIAGNGASVFSFTHAEDAASAIVAALDKNMTGALNVVDDDPAPLREWLPVLAAIVGGPRPKHIPVSLARMAVGGWGVAFLTGLRGADNSRARLQLDWRPRYSSWREGFAAEFGDVVSAAV